MFEAGFRGFLGASFAILQREMPAAYATLCRHLAAHEVSLAVDGEVVPVRFEPQRTQLLDRPETPAIEVRTARAAILDLVDARCTLHDAIMSDRLELRGRPDDLLRFHDGLMAYLHGAMRAPSFPKLLQSFRLSASTAAERRS